MGFKTNRKTGNVFNDNKQRSDQHHGSVKPQSGIKSKTTSNHEKKSLYDMTDKELENLYAYYKGQSNQYARERGSPPLIRYHDEILTEIEFEMKQRKSKMPIYWIFPKNNRKLDTYATSIKEAKEIANQLHADGVNDIHIFKSKGWCGNMELIEKI